MSYYWFVLAVVLYTIASVLIIIEVFFPTGGFISLFSLACIIGGVAIFFKYSVIMGWVGIVIAAVFVPLVVVMAYKIFPKTRLNKNTTLNSSQNQDK